MNKLVLLLSLLLPLSVVAEEPVLEEEGYEWYTKDVQCGDAETIFKSLTEWGEKPLFMGNAMSLSKHGVGTKTMMMFTINEETKSWTVIETTNDKMNCIVAFGQGIKALFHLDNGIEL